MRRTIAGLAFAGLALLSPATAGAHKGNPNMQSVVRSVTPHAQGLTLDVLNRDDRFQLTNRTGKPILIYGYDGEQYARVLPDGSVEVNKNSPAYYLNQDRTGTGTPVPKTASDTAPPAWSTIDRTGRFEWHDHRMHYMGKGVPPQVKDHSKRQKIDDYTIPIKVGAQKGAIHGSLLWTPQKNGGPPVGAIVAFAIVVLAGGALVVRARRRRDGEGPGDDGGHDEPGQADRPAVEAW
jgi:hypothetical protein